MISATINTIQTIFEEGFFYHPIQNNYAFLQIHQTFIRCC